MLINYIPSLYLQSCLIIWLAASLLNACAPQPPVPSPGHINTATVPPPKGDIPSPVQQLAYVPPPQPTPALEVYSVVVESLPVNQLLSALAQEANVNVDIRPGIDDRKKITLNAVNQTLPQILERIAKQADLLYQIEGTRVIISPDVPTLRTYKIGYVNMSRDSTSEMKIATQIIATPPTIGGATGGTSGSSGGSVGGGNNSTTQITNKSNNHFWETLKSNIEGLLSGGRTDQAPTTVTVQNNVIINPESGILTVRATHKQHEEIQKFLDQVLASVQRQVLIEATIAEVRLSNEYQAGVDWQRISGDFTYNQSTLAGNLGTAPFYSIGYSNPNSRFGNISASVRLLERFGTVKVLSSPKVMVLNNQTAVIKVVENIVYFTIGVTQNTQTTTGGGVAITGNTYTTTPNALPVGLIMNVTPQIGDNDVVILNVRPTISRITGYKQDPNPMFTNVASQIPETQERQIESILKINNGDIAIIGGLMEDRADQAKQGVPLISKLPLVGDLFSYRDDSYTKTELVIFLRPTVIKDASLQGDFQDYRKYLPDPTKPDTTTPTGLIH